MVLMIVRENMRYIWVQLPKFYEFCRPISLYFAIFFHFEECPYLEKKVVVKVFTNELGQQCRSKDGCGFFS